MNFSEFFTIYEAISLKQAKARNLKRKASQSYSIDTLNRVFGKKDRLIFDIDLEDTEVIQRDNPIIDKINKLLQAHIGSDLQIRSRREYKQGIIFNTKDTQKKTTK